MWFQVFDLTKFRQISSDHKYRARGHLLGIERISLVTNGKERCSFVITLKEIPARTQLRFPELSQRRLPDVSSLNQDPRNRPVPLPDDVYPGTVNPGHLCHYSRAPVIHEGHIAGRKRIAADFGQQVHAFVSERPLKTAYDDFQNRKNHLIQQNTSNPPTISPEGFEHEMALARLRYQQSSRKVNGAYTSVQILKTRRDQIEANKRRWNREYMAERGREDDCVDMRMKALKGFRHVFKGSSIKAMFREVKNIAKHDRPLRAFWSRNRWASKLQYQSHLARQSYYPRLAAYISGKISHRQFYSGASPVIKKNREGRKDSLRKLARKTPKKMKEEWLNNRPIVTTGISHSKASKGRAGQATHVGFLSTSARHKS